MHKFNFENIHINSKKIENTTYQQLADTIGTPFYAYSTAKLKEDIRTLKNIMPEELAFFYSLKANPNLSLVQLIHKQGMGCEVCSLTELETALQAGANGNNIIFVGPGKSRLELTRCVEVGVKAVIVESIEEMTLLNDVAKDLGKTQKFAFRINPNFTPSKARLVMSGKSSQFGIDEDIVVEQIQQLDQYSNLTLSGLHIYLGTRILEAQSVVENTKNILALAERIQSYLSEPLSFVDIGGGLGVPYYPKESFIDLPSVSKGIAPVVKAFRHEHPDTHVIMELGRYIVARAGIFVTQVRYVKTSKGKPFAICDGGSNCHGSAAGLGSAIRKNFPMAALGTGTPKTSNHYMVTGPLCTPTDLIGDSVNLSELYPGSLIGVFHSGAYGPTASPVNFLSFGYPSEVLVDGNSVLQIRRSEGVDHFMNQQQPQRLELVSENKL
ncbi:type III PLP-dependent enzyme [Vibrio splendidus]